MSVIYQGIPGNSWECIPRNFRAQILSGNVREFPGNAWESRVGSWEFLWEFPGNMPSQGISWEFSWEFLVISWEYSGNSWEFVWECLGIPGNSQMQVPDSGPSLEPRQIHCPPPSTQGARSEENPGDAPGIFAGN